MSCIMRFRRLVLVWAGGHALRQFRRGRRVRRREVVWSMLRLSSVLMVPLEWGGGGGVPVDI